MDGIRYNCRNRSKRIANWDLYLAIGGRTWGGSDEAESLATIRAAVGHGINLIDTAPRL